jgi:RNA polymerase sigma factor (sigma-70 family)
MEVLELLGKLRTDPGCRQAQEELYLCVRQGVLPYLSSRISAKLKARVDPEDVLHDAYLRVLGALDVFHPTTERAFLAWVYQIAKNLLIDCTRRRSLAARRFAGSASSIGGVRASGIVSPDRGPQSSIERRDWIEGALRRLDETEAQVIRQRGLEGKSFEDIAASSGRTPGAVQRMYSRAIERLRGVLSTGTRTTRAGRR